MKKPILLTKGGHCIGFSPYYLAQKAQEDGYHPEVILVGRRINDSMGSYVTGGITCTKVLPAQKFDSVILAVAHKEFLNLNLKALTNPLQVVYDVKGLWLAGEGRM